MNKKQKLQKKILEIERYIKSVEKDIANITKHIKKCKEILQTLKT